jgi:NAD(P)H-hydrate epimerase
MIPMIAAAEVPYLSTDQMIEVDRAVIVEYGVDLVRMMENAGRALAHLARERFLDGDPRGKNVVALAGSGGNGGGVLVAARRLHNYGARVTAVMAKPDEALSAVPREQLAILRNMGATIGGVGAVDQLEATDLVLDGLIGYGLRGAPRGAVAALIRWANLQTSPVLSLDVPSGVDTTTGTVSDPAVDAAATMTLALPKAGLRTPGIERKVGDLYLADISVPPELYERFLGVQAPPIFAKSDIVQLV